MPLSAGRQASLLEQGLTLHAHPGTVGKRGQASEQAPARVQFALVSKILQVKKPQSCRTAGKHGVWCAVPLCLARGDRALLLPRGATSSPHPDVVRV